MVSILLVDDSIFTCSAIQRILAEQDLDILIAQNAAEAFLALDKSIPDLILLNLILPDMDGYRVAARLREREELQGIPLIFLTSNSDEASILRGFEAGAVDYIFKPFSPAEFLARVSCHLKNKLMADELRVANQKLEAAMKELNLQNRKDPLTGIYNRRYALEQMNNWRTEAEQPSEAFLMLMDIDNFKKVNDTFGHCAGDYILFTVCDLIVRRVGSSGSAVRWGGDELLLLLPGISKEQAVSLAFFLLEDMKAYPFCYDGQPIPCSITIGVSRFDLKQTIEENLSRADEALYTGKRLGKGQVMALC